MCCEAPTGHEESYLSCFAGYTGCCALQDKAFDRLPGCLGVPVALGVRGALLAEFYPLVGHRVTEFFGVKLHASVRAGAQGNSKFHVDVKDGPDYFLGRRTVAPLVHDGPAGQPIGVNEGVEVAGLEEVSRNRLKEEFRQRVPQQRFLG